MPKQNRYRGAGWSRRGWDVVNFNGEFVLELIKNEQLIAPYVSSQQVALEDDFKDGKGYWSGLHAQPIVLGYNTKLIKKEDVPTSYEALLNSRWKGKKISIDNEGLGLLKGLESAWGKLQAVDYLKKLAAQGPVPCVVTRIGFSSWRRVNIRCSSRMPIPLRVPSTLERRSIGFRWIPCRSS